MVLDKLTEAKPPRDLRGAETVQICFQEDNDFRAARFR